MEVKSIRARVVSDSRGVGTISVGVNGVWVSAPSGKSTGFFESQMYHKSIAWNVKVLNNLSFPFEFSSFDDLVNVEKFLKKKFKLRDVKLFGANALFAFEAALLNALAKSQGVELFRLLNPRARRLPVPVGNVVGGGLHSHNNDRPEFQEFLLIPQGSSARENVRLLKGAHERVQKLVGASKKNDEGAWETGLSNEEVLAKLSSLKRVRLGLDVAANSFFSKGSYKYDNLVLDKNAQVGYLNALVNEYDLLYVEDPLVESDFSSFAKVNHSPRHLVVGDDLTATHLSRLKRALKSKSINAMILKPNQNGSLVEFASIVKLCKANKVKMIVSHRSGETLDTTIVDLAVGFGAHFLKAGAATKWRLAKLDRLVEIERLLK